MTSIKHDPEPARAERNTLLYMAAAMKAAAPLPEVWIARTPLEGAGVMGLWRRLGKHPDRD